MSRFLINILLSVLFTVPVFGQLEFSSNESGVLTITPDANTGLNKIYVLETTSNLEAVFSSNASVVSVYSFGNLGASYSTPLSVEKVSPNSYGFSLLETDSGYIITEDNKTTYYWIISYAKNRSTISGIFVSPESDCEVTVIDAVGTAPALTYYTILGQPKELSRDFLLNYTTLSFDNSSFTFVPASVDVSISGIESEIRVSSPLCATEFSLSSDRFMRFFGEDQTFIAPLSEAKAVSGNVKAEIISEMSSNQMASDSDSELGGSASLEISFSAVVSEAAAFTEWQISSDPLFETIELRYTDTDISYTFTREGKFFVRFVASDSDGACSWVSDPFIINIGTSLLECPNAFSPSSSPGVNDEWKVSFRSIISFECHIFNRWGTEIATLTHPSQGWDGKFHGKTVPSGVYFYVINATGADGKQYNLSGDINVINSKTTSVK